MKALLLLIFSFDLLLSVATKRMAYPQYRRFRPIIRNEKDLRQFVGTNQHLISHCRVLYRKNQTEATQQLVIGDGKMPFANALKVLWESHTHSIIFSYESARALNQAVRLFFNATDTPQVWTYYECTQGPGGDKIPRKNVVLVFRNLFIRNRILAVAWTRGERKNGTLAKYTWMHINDMDDRLQHYYHYTLVLVFDAVILSNSPLVANWMSYNMGRMAVLIRLYDPKDADQINVEQLKRFVMFKVNGPFFFDLPEKLHAELIRGNPKFTTPPQSDKGCGAVEVLFGSQVYHFICTCGLVWVRMGLK